MGRDKHLINSGYDYFINLCHFRNAIVHSTTLNDSQAPGKVNSSQFKEQLAQLNTAVQPVFETPQKAGNRSAMSLNKSGNSPKNLSSKRGTASNKDSMQTINSTN